MFFQIFSFKLILRSGKHTLASEQPKNNKCKSCSNKTVHIQEPESTPKTKVNLASVENSTSNLTATKTMASSDDILALKNELSKLVVQSVGELRESFTETNQMNTLNLAALTKQCEEANTYTSSGTNAFRPRKFAGTNDDIHAFLQDFEYYAAFCRWKEDRQLSALPMLLTDNARSWYDGLDKTTFATYNDLKELMLAHFNSEARKWAIRQKFSQQKQKANETVADYTSTLRTYFQHLAIPESEQMQYFISGLLPPLRRYTILQSPKSLSDAESAATLYEATADNTNDITINALQTLVSSQNKLTERLAVLEGNPTLAAFQNPGPNSPGTSPPPRNNLENRYDRRDSFRPRYNDTRETRNPRDNSMGPNDLAKAIEIAVNRLQRQHNSNFHNRQGHGLKQHQFQRDRFSSNARGDFGRSNRTTDGRVFCTRCNKIGHNARSCWHNDNSQHKDPRIPRRGFPVRSSQGQNYGKNEHLN